jgi:transposase
MRLKNRVVNFYNKNKYLGKSFVAKHFLDEKVPKSTVYRLISSAEQGESGERKKGSGRPTKIASKVTVNRLTQKFNKSCGISQKSAAVTLNCSRPYVSMMLKRHTNIKRRKRTRKPKRTASQL